MASPTAGESRTETAQAVVPPPSSAEEAADDKAATAHAAAELQSFWFADQIAHYPCRVISIVYAVLILLFIIVSSVGFKIDDPGNRDYNIQRARNTRNANALVLVRDMVHGSDDTKASAIRSNDDDDFLLMILYRVDSDDEDATLLTVERLRHLQFLENGIQAQCPDGSSAIGANAKCTLAEADLDRWPRLCWSGLQTKFNVTAGPPYRDADYPCADTTVEKAYDSFLRVLEPHFPGGKLTDSTTQAQVDAAVAAMAQNAVDTKTELILGQYFGKGWDAATAKGRKPKYARAFFRFGRPLIKDENERFSDPLDRETEQTALYNKHSNAVIHFLDKEGNGVGVQTIGAGLQYIQNLFQITSQTDFMWALASMLFVWSYITFHTRSFFLSSMAMLEIALSFPAAYFIYRFIFQVDYFQFAHMLSIFIILGIGADNCFVYHDSFIQSTQEHVELRDPAKLNLRVAYTFRRAATAMFVTTLTTFAAFLVTAISPVIPIATFGMYAAVLVACKYLLVVTLFPAVVVFWHLHLRGTKCGCVGKRHVPEDDLHAQSLQSGAASPVDHKRRTSAVVLTSSEARNDEALSPRQMEEEIPMTELPANGKGASASSGGADGDRDLEVAIPDLTKVHSRVGAADTDEYRPIERFFMNTWSPMLHTYRWQVLGGFCAFFIICVSLAAQIEPIREQEQWLPSDHVLTKAINWPVDFFPQSEHDQFIEVTLLWGTDGVDFSNSPRLNPNALGDVILDKKFDVSSRDAQQSIWSFCDTMRKRSDIVFEGEGAVSCWATGYRTWLEAKNMTFPQPAVNFTRTLESFLASPEGVLYVIGQDVGIVDGKVVYVSAHFASNTPLLGSFGAIRDAEVLWSDIVDDYNSGAPEGVNNAVQTAGVAWTWIDSQNALFKSSFTGIGLALTVAFLALTLSTMNIIVGLVATLAIGGICTSVMGTIYVIGWEFGFTESVAIVMIIGLSVDYTVHLGNAYVESPRLSRTGRMDDSLRQFGISVVAGGITTMGSSLFLFGAQLIFFFKFGTAVLLTVIYSWTWALGFFSAAMYALGPQDQVGSIHVWIALAKERWEAYQQGKGKVSPSPARTPVPQSESSSAAI